MGLTGCATVPIDGGVPIHSASGRSEAYFSGPPEQTMGKITSGCMGDKDVVTESIFNEVVCQMPMSFGRQLMSQMMIGNAYSILPEEFLRLNIIPTF